MFGRRGQPQANVLIVGKSTTKPAVPAPQRQAFGIGNFDLLAI